MNCYRQCKLNLLRFNPRTNTEIKFFDLFTFVSQNIERYKFIGSFWDKDDLLQESYLWLWEILNDGVSSPESLGIAVKRNIDNRVRTKRRAQSKEYRLINLIKAESPTAQLPEKTEAEQELIRQCIDRAFNKLTPKQRDTIVMFFGFDGLSMSVTEIARVKNKNPRSIRKERFLSYEILAQDTDLQSLVS